MGDKYCTVRTVLHTVRMYGTVWGIWTKRSKGSQALSDLTEELLPTNQVDQNHLCKAHSLPLSRPHIMICVISDPSNGYETVISAA
jgi:hypothetical protein